MEQILQNLNRVEGVIGSAIYNRGGHCVGFELPPPYEPVLLSEVVSRLDEAADVYTTLPQFEQPKSYTVSFGGGYLVVRPVDVNLLMLIGTADVNMSLLSVALNVACLKLSRALAAGGPPPSPVTARYAGARADAPVSSQAPSRMPHERSVARAGAFVDEPTTISGLLNEMQGAAFDPPPADAVGRDVLTHLIREFAAFYRGNIRMALQEEFENLGATPRTLRGSQFADFMHNLAERIEEPSRRSRFITKALGDM